MALQSIVILKQDIKNQTFQCSCHLKSLIFLYEIRNKASPLPKCNQLKVSILF